MKVLIVGGVAGGAGTAARLRRQDEHAEIILFEKGSHISFANCGMPYYIGNEITEKSALCLQTPESFRNRFRVDVRTGHEVVAVDLQNKSVNVQKEIGMCKETYVETYDKLVLAPGAEPITAGIDGGDSEHVFTMRNLSDTFAIDDFIVKKKPSSCVVVGGGFIGLEMAENLARRGIGVSVIEAGTHLMPSLDIDMAQELHQAAYENHVELYLNRKCCFIGSEYVVLDDGLHVPADLVILCIGVEPRTAFLRDSGIVLGNRGEICVNEWMETSAKDVYALGDAVASEHIVSGRRELIPLASPAARQARTVVGELVGKRQAYHGVQGTSVLRFFGKVAAATGLNERKLQQYGIPYKKSYTYSASHAGYYPGASMMAIKLLFSPDDGKVLGAQIVGVDGVDKRIDVLAAAIRCNMTVYELQDLELAYAPPFSSSKDPVNVAGYVAGNILDQTMLPFYVEELEELPKDAECIDVRTKGEYDGGFIPGFRNIPLDELRERLDEVDISKPVYITCQIGLRGYLAQRILMQRGYECYNLLGGYRFYRMLQGV